MVETGLGRAAIREALRMLEVEALVTLRFGRYGGGPCAGRGAT